MSNVFKIVVKNDSGASQNYKLFGAAPKITGGVDPQVWNNVFLTADYTQPGASATFTMWKQYYGIVGTVKGTQAISAQVQVSQTIGVDLGLLQENGTVIPGTTLEMAVAGGIQPYFNTTFDEQSANANSFAIQTDSTFTVASAKSGNFMVGVAAATNDGSVRPIASFMPEPGCDYQIQPVNAYYLSFGGSLQLGQLADITKIGNKCMVDFTSLPSVVQIVHTPTGKLVIQTSG